MPFLPTVASRPRHRRSFLTVIGILFAGIFVSAGESETGEAPPFHVRFWADGIEITGSVPSRKSAVQLREVLYRVRNRLLLWDDMKIVERTTPFPDIDSLSGLIRELDLSTRSGELRITDSAIAISGLTDSLVTQAAFAARLADLSTSGRELRNEICIVASEDLVSLNVPRPAPPATKNSKPFRSLPKPVVLYEEPFGPWPETPVLADHPLASPTPIKLSEMQNTETLSESEPAPPSLSYRLEPLSSVEFGPDSFLIQVSQVSTIQKTANSINQLPASQLPVILTGFPDNDGEHAYNDWIGGQRAREVFELLKGMGVAANRLSLGNYRDGTSKNQGTVTVFVPHLEPIVAAPVEQAALASPE